MAPREPDLESERGTTLIAEAAGADRLPESAEGLPQRDIAPQRTAPTQRDDAPRSPERVPLRTAPALQPVGGAQSGTAPETPTSAIASPANAAATAECAAPATAFAAPPKATDRSAKTQGDASRSIIVGKDLADSRSSTAPPPALGRAIEVEHAVRLEQLTGQGPAWPAEAAVRLESGAGSVAGTGTGGTDSAPLNTLDRSAPAPEPPMTARLVRGLSAMVNQRGGVMTMRLDPPELGQLRIQMQLHQGTVTAQFHPSTAQAQQLIERSLAVSAQCAREQRPGGRAAERARRPNAIERRQPAGRSGAERARRFRARRRRPGIARAP